MALHYQGARGSRQQARGAAPSAGGNALSYRPDAVPGYTGYVPGSQCVPVSLHTKVSERAPGATLYRPRVQNDEPGSGGSGRTTYGAAYQTDPLHDYSVDPRVRLPQAAAAAPPAPDCAPGMPPRPQMASCRSTYQAELLDQPPSFNTCSAGGGSIRSTASAPVSPAAGAAARPGYLTTAAASQLPIAEAFAASFSLSAGSGPKIAALGSQTPQRPSNGANSSMPTAAARHGPTPELTAAAGGTACRPSKADAFLHALDQHSRGRLPGYTGHRPQHNVGLELPPPTKLTTWGAASQEALRAQGAKFHG